MKIQRFFSIQIKHKFIEIFLLHSVYYNFHKILSDVMKFIDFHLQSVEDKGRVDSMVSLRFDLDCDIALADVSFQETNRDWMRFVVHVFDSIDCISRWSLENIKLSREII